MHRVIVLDNLAPEGLALLESAADIEVEVRTGLKGAELKQALTQADAAICRSGVTLDGDALTGNRRLKAIVRAGVGTDNIDKPAATRLGIVRARRCPRSAKCGAPMTRHSIDSS